MIVTPIRSEVALLPGYFRQAAEFVSEQPDGGREVLWFDVPDWLCPEATGSGAAWLLAALPLAFVRGERLRVEAPLDPYQVRNAEELLRIWSRWHPPHRPIAIEGPAISPSTLPNDGRTGVFFTCGIDSFFTLLHYDELMRTAPLPGERLIDDLIFVWGYDIPLARPEAFAGMERRLQAVGRAFQKKVITLVSNFRETSLGKLDWEKLAHGAALGAAALLLGKRLGKAIISSSFNYALLPPWGSQPVSDPYMSTAHTQLLHYGAGFDRLVKTEYVARHRTALEHLRVCWRDQSDRNCGRCEKCYRTLLTLEILGVREQATNFPPDCFTLDQVRLMRSAASKQTQAMLRYVMGMLRDHALARSRTDVAQAITAALARGRRLDRLERLIDLGGRVTGLKRRARQLKQRLNRASIQ